MTVSTTTEVSPTSLRILLVDDDDAVRGVIMRVLCRLGHEVSPCASAEETEPYGGASHEIAIVDLNLGHGGNDGLDLLRRLKAELVAQCFVLISGAQPPPPTAELEGVLFLKKPFSRGDLADVIEQAKSRLSRRLPSEDN